jgi:hypothetical protein
MWQFKKEKATKMKVALLCKRTKFHLIVVIIFSKIVTTLLIRKLSFTADEAMLVTNIDTQTLDNK